MHPVDIDYLLKFDDQVVPIHGNLTLGRHLDNDVLVAGEDVLDFHVRIEVRNDPRQEGYLRGPTAVPLGDATINVNGVEHARSVGLIAGDVLTIGGFTTEIGIERELPARAGMWQLQPLLSQQPADGSPPGFARKQEPAPEAITLQDVCIVGRQNDCGLPIEDEHISRHHARLIVVDGAVFVQDLNSANGTSVNGQALIGGCRLHHGDVVAFDQIAYRLVGSGGEVTAIRAPTLDDLQPIVVETQDMPSPRVTTGLASPYSVPPGETTEVPTVAVPSDPPAVLPQTDAQGSFLLGITPPIAGQVFHTQLGRSVLGRSPECHVYIDDATVSAQHAEVVSRPEGLSITNLMATNGTVVNGNPVEIASLKDGDVIRLGQVQLVYRDVAQIQERGPLRALLPWVLAGSVLLAIAFGLLLW